MTESLGQYLKRKRIEQGISLESISEDTHIRIQYLQALEEDDRQRLPSAVQARGFLRLYAEILKIQPSVLLSYWDGSPIPEELEESVVSELHGSPIGSEADEAIDRIFVEDVSLTPEVADEIVENKGDATATLSIQNQLAAEAPDTIEALSLTSSQVFAEIGKMFRDQRKALSFSLDDIESITHIRRQNLSAMEENQFEELPSGVQARGMLQSYAEFLHLDSEIILGMYAEGLQTRRLEKNQQIPATSKTKIIEKTPKKVTSLRQFLSADLIIGVFLILGILIVAVLSITKVISTRQADLSLQEGITRTNVAALSATPTLTVTPTTTNTPAPTSDLIVLPSNEENAQAFPILETPVDSNARVRLHIIANQRAFLRIIADDKMVFNGRVVPGNAYQFSADNQIDLLCGNGAAISVLFIQDGVETNLGTLGAIGEVINIAIRPDLVLTPTALPSLTPTITNTPRPTATPEMAEDMQPSPTP